MGNVNNVNRQFLDYKGLETLWEKIKDTFPYRSESIATVEFKGTGDGVQLHYTKADGTNDNIILPIANHENAGIITSNTYDTITRLQGGSADLVPIAGLKINSKVASLNDRYANIKLDYNTRLAEDGKTKRSYLSLIDANFIGGAHWDLTTESDYNNETSDGTSSNKYYTKVKESDGSYSYYKWYAGDDNCEPAYDNYGPILVTPISEIDVTEFVKAGLLKSATYDSTSLKIKLVFYTYDTENGTEGETEFDINVGDFIDEYQEGEGISIIADLSYGDGEKNISTIALVDAKVDKLGGIKVAKDNAVAVKSLTSSINSDVTGDTQNNSRYIGVETDKDNKAFVYVPWMNTSVTTESEQNTHGLILSTSESNLTNNISLGEGTVESLQKADTAIQTLTILGYPLDYEAKKEVSKDEAITALELRSASHIDHIETFTDLDATTTATNDTKLPTRGAVKDHVQSELNKFKESLDSETTVAEFTIPRTEYPTDDAYYNQKGRYVFATIKLEDGVIKRVDRLLSIYDIVDFAPITDAEINTICTIP